MSCDRVSRNSGRLIATWVKMCVQVTNGRTQVVTTDLAEYLIASPTLPLFLLASRVKTIGDHRTAVHQLPLMPGSAMHKQDAEDSSQCSQEELGRKVYQGQHDQCHRRSGENSSTYPFLTRYSLTGDAIVRQMNGQEE